MYHDDHSVVGAMNMSPSTVEVHTYVKEPTNDLEDFIDSFKRELYKGAMKYGSEDETIDFVKSIDVNFELGAVAKYISRISRGDSRAKEDCIKAATYLYFYWRKLTKPEREGSL